jgi:uncharacterized glyoxalase superfamily protein PhnB
MKAPEIHSSVPVISTDNIEGSLAYYQNVLGFSFDFKYGDPPVYAGVNSGIAEIYFTHNPDLVQAIKEKSLSPDIFIWVTDADHFFNLHVKNGAEIIEPILDRPWGARQYVVKELNGYHLKFAQPL